MMKKYEFDKLLTNLVGSGVLIIQDIYSNDGKNEHLHRYYEVNYGALES